MVRPGLQLFVDDESESTKPKVMEPVAGRRDAIALTSIAGVIGGSLCALAAVRQTSPLAFFVLLAASLFCTAGATNSVVISLQTLAPDRMRATLAACALLSITLLGLCVGPPVTAWIATTVSPQGQGVGVALGVLSAVVAIPCTVLFLISRGRSTEQMA